MQGQSPLYFYLLFFLVIIIGGILGGLLQALRSKETYTLRKPNLANVKKDTNDEQVQYWDLGFWGFLMAGAITAVLAVGVVTLSGSADFSAISKGAYGNDKKETIPIPLEMFHTGHEKHLSDINKIVELIVLHNNSLESNSLNSENEKFWTWIKLLCISILSGFGGVTFVSNAYKRYVGQEQMEQVQQQLKLEHKRTTQNIVDVNIQNIRDLLKDKQPEVALQLCEQTLEIAPNNPRLMGNKARALRSLGRLSEAIDVLESTFDKTEISPSLRARLYINLACYKFKQQFGDSLPDEIEKQPDLLKEVEHILTNAIALDSHVKKAISADEDLKPLHLLQAKGINWFADLIN